MDKNVGEDIDIGEYLMHFQDEVVKTRQDANIKLAPAKPTLLGRTF